MLFACTLAHNCITHCQAGLLFEVHSHTPVSLIALCKMQMSKLRADAPNQRKDFRSRICGEAIS